MRTTNAAYFLAKVHYESMIRSELDLSKPGFRSFRLSWDQLPKHDKVILAKAMQNLINLRVIEPISLGGVSRLRLAGWNSVRRPQDEPTIITEPPKIYTLRYLMDNMQCFSSSYDDNMLEWMEEVTREIEQLKERNESNRGHDY